MTHHRHFFAVLLCTALLTVAATAAQAQTAARCRTPSGWCPAPYPGPPGARCQCPTPRGWVSGTLG